jgi:abequosyltransferase
MKKIQYFQISICIPTYNFGEFIAETIESITSQVEDGVEIIIGDGASTDNTEGIVKELISRYKNIFYHRFEKKGGIDVDLFKVIEKARGEYCWLFSADDLMGPGAIRRILAEIEAGHLVYLCNRLEMYGKVPNKRVRPWLSRRYGDMVFNLSDDRQFEAYLGASRGLGALFGYMSSIIIHRSSWATVEIKKDFIGSNYAHASKVILLARNGGLVKYIQEPLVIARMGNDSFMSNGIARRFLIDFKGYQLIAVEFFSSKVLLKALKTIMRREHKWYHLPSLALKVSNEDWILLMSFLKYYGYQNMALYLSKEITDSRLMRYFFSRLKLIFKIFSIN